MTSNMDESVVKSVRALYKKDEAARELFDQCADRERDASATSIDRMTYKLGISREEAVGLAQRLEEAGCGEFVVGRRGHKSRFVWAYSCISLGQVAAGETTLLEKPDDPLPETDDERETASPGSQSRMTIQEAKRALSDSLGVSESAIEILIRA